MKKYFLKAIVIITAAISSHTSFAQYSHEDSLRGSIGAGRAWWDVKKYNVAVDVNIPDQSISGITQITFTIIKDKKTRYMQLDLQKPMEIEKIEWLENKKESLVFRREGNVFWVDFGEKNFEEKREYSVLIYFKGKPRVAVNAPWDGGWVWAKDGKGRPWVTVACQGLGASVWYPCKDHQSDEPDNGATLSITVPDSLTAVGNGRLNEKKVNGDGTTTWQWEVTNPINTYNIIPYIGKYVSWHDEYNGENGKLDLDYWVLDYNLAKAKQQFTRDVKPMLSCFENWFGPYPFYGDSYKMVETPHLGMEHQSAIAYGNKFMNGYLGNDLSGTGWGNKWDYIIIHESGHEWFANNITTNDIADMWVHEGFTDYSEVLFVECLYGKKAANEYCHGLRNSIANDRPVIGAYGVNKEGSGDMYAKGANLIHTLRQVINNDITFKKILRGLNKAFYHSTVDSKDIENYISSKSGKDLSKIFDQYLRTIKIPRLEYKIKGYSFSYRWTNCVKGFKMPVRLFSGGKERWITPEEKWQTRQMPGWLIEKSFSIDKNFYINEKKIDN
ncbi:MAG: M1 family metallopeptidase [Chitinophagaceae bacterium]